MAYNKQWNPQKPAARTIEAPEVRDAGKYGILCCIPYGRYNNEFAFGLTKAKAIVKFYPFIKKFVDTSGQTKFVDFEEDPELKAMVEEKIQKLKEQDSDKGAYVRQIMRAHESTENYTKFREGAEV